MAKRGTLEHPKTTALARRLGIPVYAALGLLEALWHLAARYAGQGDVGRYADDELAAWLRYDEDAERMVDALVLCGWLDPHPVHRLVVHDWHEHMDQAVRKWLQYRKEKPVSAFKVSREARLEWVANRRREALGEPSEGLLGEGVVVRKVGDSTRFGPTSYSSPDFRGISAPFSGISEAFSKTSPAVAQPHNNALAPGISGDFPQDRPALESEGDLRTFSGESPENGGESTEGLRREDGETGQNEGFRPESALDDDAIGAGISREFSTDEGEDEDEKIAVENDCCAVENLRKSMESRYPARSQKPEARSQKMNSFLFTTGDSEFTTKGPETDTETDPGETPNLGLPTSSETAGGSDSLSAKSGEGEGEGTRRGRGRPRKVPTATPALDATSPRKRGRPRKAESVRSTEAPKPSVVGKGARPRPLVKPQEPTENRIGPMTRDPVAEGDPDATRRRKDELRRQLERLRDAEREEAPKAATGLDAETFQEGLDAETPREPTQNDRRRDSETDGTSGTAEGSDPPQNESWAKTGGETRVEEPDPPQNAAQSPETTTDPFADVPVFAAGYAETQTVAEIVAGLNPAQVASPEDIAALKRDQARIAAAKADRRGA